MFNFIYLRIAQIYVVMFLPAIPVRSTYRHSWIALPGQIILDEIMHFIYITLHLCSTGHVSVSTAAVISSEPGVLIKKNNFKISLFSVFFQHWNFVIVINPCVQGVIMPQMYASALTNGANVLLNYILLYWWDFGV